MRNITLTQLLEAGCHFGHKAERWHPKAGKYIYTEKDGVHIIDLAKTRDCLLSAADFAYNIGKTGRTLLFVATKRQASDVVASHARAAGAPYLTKRWIGGFLTNWDSIRKNIERINKMTEEQAKGSWKKFPKHEQYKLARVLKRLNLFYVGVLDLKSLPDAIFVVDIRKEDSAVREARRRGLPIMAVVDTNANPDDIDYPIPANDDAVGSISLLTQTVAEAYREGREEMEKDLAVQAKEKPTASAATSPVALSPEEGVPNQESTVNKKASPKKPAVVNKAKASDVLAEKKSRRRVSKAK